MSFSRTKNMRFLDGFPWPTALVAYTISWGWSLIRPNTLYWDDWAYVFNQPKSYLKEIFSKTGLPPWRALVDQELLAVGYWTIRWLTFIMFFTAGLFLFEILRQIPFISLIQSRSIALLFLVLPFNHARIALVMFGYTTSYFLFFLAWMLLVKSSSWMSILSACLSFAWSFMTHSFLIFSVLPIIHFVYLNYTRISIRKLKLQDFAKLSVLLTTPMLYYVLRSMYWPPDVEYLWYHTIYLRAVFVSMVYLLPFVVSAVGVVLWERRGKPVTSKSLMVASGFLAFGIGVIPYISSGNLDSRMVLFFWELGWTSRHQLLMPLGASAIVVGIVFLLSENKSRLILGLVFAVSISLNVFWGIGSYVDSVKRDKLVELVTQGLASNKSPSIAIIDRTQHLNFRAESYRKHEFAGLLSKAGKAPVPAVKDECEDDSNRTEVIITSDKSLLEAFFSRDLGLTLEIRPCKSN